MFQRSVSLEDAGQLLARNSWTGVAHGDDYIVRTRLSTKGDRVVRSTELDRVSEKVPEDLENAKAIARDLDFVDRQLGVQMNALCGGQLLMALERVDEKWFQRHHLTLERNLPRLDRRHVEQIVEQVLHALDRAANRLERLRDRFCGPARRDFRREQAGAGRDHTNLIAEVMRHEGEDLLSRLNGIPQLRDELRLDDDHGGA